MNSVTFIKIRILFIISKYIKYNYYDISLYYIDNIDLYI